ncbi:Flagellar hook-associated protein 2 domain protein [Desulfatibacillum aliphaticivorans]|uniref:Flagellar hook-associated protein 2 domain protein n=1 Tax=Desulfatibacillum aliphaticivorans TaxID=218208 RepID=B8FF11_DESAL|nr:flagellar filament capping protein FliD [Desulfatibacillum aliphaticivorans]ACL03828.1 Flagellar hook-associated protein 2 domain protein [Desulfatibacillum aliphaticivorans]
MNITGTYSNYLTISSLLAPLGATSSESTISTLFSSVVTKLQDQLNEAAFSRESSQALSEFYVGAADLAAKAGVLTLGDYGSVFFDRTAATSDASVVTAQARDALSSESGASTGSYAVTVEQLATAQENTGTALANTEVSVVEEGIERFKMIIEDTEFLLEVKVETGETNYIVLGKIADAINEAGAGVTAQVVDGEADGTSALQLTSETTGNAGVFLLEDVSGNAAAATGAAIVSQEAQDSVYSINGEDYTSSYNNIYLDGGQLALSLKGVGEATVTVAPDSENATNAIQAFVGELNSFIEFLQDNEQYITGDVLNSLTSYIEDQKRGLAAIGITLSEDGYLQVDGAALSQAASEDLEGVQDLFAGVDGLAVRAANLTNQIGGALPLNYAREAASVTASDLFDLGVYNSSSYILQSLLLDQVQGTVINTYA